MLSIFAKQIRPTDELSALINLTSDYETRTFRKWQKIPSQDPDFIYIAVSGSFDIRRASDDLGMFTLHEEIIFGLTGMFYAPPNVNCIARTESRVRVVPKADFLALITDNGLWQEMTKVLAWYLCLLSKRDDLLVARNAYSVVREFLIEINELFHQKSVDVNVYNYIQEYTNLARSTIVKILSELKRGNYIEVNKGRLIKIHNLPERF